MDIVSVRDDIERVIKENIINRDLFFEVPKTKWENILDTVEEKFLDKKHYKQSLNWGWELLFKEPVFTLRFLNDDGYKYLRDIIQEDRVWFIAEDHNGKMWIYDGRVDIIATLIGECYELDEYYIVSKKYEWILCENHHRILIGSGSISKNMKAFLGKNLEKLFL